jgi:sodium transport system ATP-binding protein
MSDTHTVRAQKLGKIFRGSSVWAVRNLSFDCRRGSITGLLGENGAGKTTTLRMLSTMLRPTEGSASVCGRDISTDPGMVRRSVGILFGGSSGLYERLTASENVEYFASLNGMNPAETAARLESLAQMLEMGEFLNRRAGTFSTGMRQKTLIARAIIHNPDLLLLDEPASGLDATAADSIYRFIGHCRELGKTVIFSSHDLKAVEQISDTVLLLHKGELAAHGSPDTIGGGRSLSETFSLYTGVKP